MAVDLTTYVPTLRREVTPPGSSLGTVTDAEMLGYLADAFWEARLDGFLLPWTATADGVVLPVETGGADIPRDQIALIVLYAGLKILRNTLLSTNSRFSAKAGPVSIETESSAMLMTEMARQLAAVRERLLQVDVDMTPTFLVDNYTLRVLSPSPYGHWLADALGSIPTPDPLALPGEPIV